MIKNLQKKFIQIAALSLFSVLLLVILSINGAFIYQRMRLINKHLNSLLTESEESWESDNIQTGNQAQPMEKAQVDGNSQTMGTSQGTKNANTSYTAQKLRKGVDHRSEEKKRNWFSQVLGDLKFYAKGCVIWLDEHGEIQGIRRDIDESYEEDILTPLAQDIFSAKSEKGWSGLYKYCKKTVADEDRQEEICIAIVDASSAIHAIASLLLFSLFIGLVSFVLVLIFIILASKKVIRPIAQSYEKQKQFVTDAGHELKTPLTAISADNELARLTYGDSEWFDAIDRQVKKLSHLVANLISMARMDEEQQLEFAEFNMSEAVTSVLDSFSSAVSTKDINLTSDITEGLRYKGNEEKILQLVSILMDNAMKYCDSRGEVHVCLAKSRRIHLTVTNSFSDAANFDPQKVFERFYRSDKARTSNGSYGLGLSIAKSIVELHKGSISGKALNHTVTFEVML